MIELSRTEYLALINRVNVFEHRIGVLEEVVAARVVERVSNPVPWWARLLAIRRAEDQRAFKALVLGFLAGFVLAAGAALELLR